MGAKLRFGYTRVHSDEYATGGTEFDLVALKGKPLGLLTQSLEDGQDLLSHHRQNLNVDTIELIKTTPGPRLEEEQKSIFLSLAYSAVCIVPELVH